MKKHYKNNGTHELGLSNITKIMVRTNSALPNTTKIIVRMVTVVFFSSWNRAYQYFFEPECCIPPICSRKLLFWVPIPNSAEKGSFDVPLCGGAQPGPKNKNYMKNITENHDEKSRDYFWVKSSGNL